MLQHIPAHPLTLPEKLVHQVARGLYAARALQFLVLAIAILIPTFFIPDWSARYPSVLDILVGTFFMIATISSVFLVPMKSIPVFKMRYQAFPRQLVRMQRSWKGEFRGRQHTQFALDQIPSEDGQSIRLAPLQFTFRRENPFRDCVLAVPAWCYRPAPLDSETVSSTDTAGLLSSVVELRTACRDAEAASSESTQEEREANALLAMNQAQEIQNARLEQRQALRLSRKNT